MKQPIIDQPIIYSTVRKAGRCFNGAHRDGGAVVHIVKGTEPNGFWGDKALCGTRPGDRSYGWSLTNRAATCDKCIKNHANENTN